MVGGQASMAEALKDLRNDATSKTCGADGAAVLFLTLPNVESTLYCEQRHVASLSNTNTVVLPSSRIPPAFPPSVNWRSVGFPDGRARAYNVLTTEALAVTQQDHGFSTLLLSPSMSNPLPSRYPARES